MSLDPVAHWTRTKAEGWVLDRTTLRHLLDVVDTRLAADLAIRDEMTTDEQRAIWDEAFAADTAARQTMRLEVIAAIEALMTPPRISPHLAGIPFDQLYAIAVSDLTGGAGFDDTEGGS